MTVSRAFVVAVLVFGTLLHLGHLGFHERLCRQEIYRLQTEIVLARYLCAVERASYQGALFHVFRDTPGLARPDPAVADRKDETNLSELRLVATRLKERDEVSR